MKQRVLVCGGRDFADREQLFDILDAAHEANPIELLIHGAAPGADSLAADWALSRDILCQAYPADWEMYGKGAGPIRNTKMLIEGRPHLVIAFHGDKGTRNMVDQATTRGVPVARIKARSAGRLPLQKGQADER